MGKPKDSLSLIALDIQGRWNLPLLENAASMSRAALVHAHSGDHEGLAVSKSVSFTDAVKGHNTIVACETGVKARNLFEIPAPRGRTAIVVGNEKFGIPKSVLRHCQTIITIPMHCKQLSSINVAASSAVALYALSRDLARKGAPNHARSRPQLDLLIRAPADPAECGSLLRSAAAFGWKAVYLDDPDGSWLTNDKERVSLSRGAARREINPLVVLNAAKLRSTRYDRVLWCADDRTGTPLPRYRLEGSEAGLLAFGAPTLPQGFKALPCTRIHVDFRQTGITPFARHEGSVVLAVLAEQLRGRRRG